MTEALATIRHRGPDGGDVISRANLLLGHQRLAIIDRHHPAELSHGPFQDKEHQLWVSYNGEIINYRPLRSELEKLGHHFLTDSDTEVLTKVWAQWGPDGIKRLRGMYAFVIYDERTKETTIGRDPLGIKPLYIHQSSTQIIVASEIKALGHFIPFALNQHGLMEYFMFGYVARPKTMFQNILQIMPGTLSTIDAAGAITTQQLDILEQTAANDQSIKEVVQQYRFSDAGLSVLLSGGVDSSYLTAVLSLSSSPLKTFGLAVDHPTFDESPYQKEIAERFHCQHQALKADADLFMQHLAHATWGMDAPVFHQGSILLYALYRQVAASAKVAITGEGADELFAGYDRYLLDQSMLANRLSKFPSPQGNELERLLARLDAVYPYLRRLYLSPSRIQKLCPALTLDMTQQSERMQFLATRELTIDTIYQHDQRYHLEALLSRQDRMSSLASVECRVPFCDINLWQKYGAVSLAEKTQPLGAKSMLKKELGRFMPEEFSSRRKKGLGLPTHQWLATTSMRALLDVVQSPQATQRGLYDQAWMAMELKRFAADDHASSQYLMRAIMFEIWCQEFNL